MLPLRRGTLALALATLVAALGPSPVQADQDQAVPDVVVGFAGHTIDAPVLEYCWSWPNEVVAGQGEIGSAECAPRTERRVPAIRHRHALRLEFDRAGWRWRARYVSTGSAASACRATKRTVPVGERAFRLRRPPHPGTYRVTLSGHGPEGNVVAAFVWRYGTGRCS